MNTMRRPRKNHSSLLSSGTRFRNVVLLAISAAGFLLTTTSAAAQTHFWVKTGLNSDGAVDFEVSPYAGQDSTETPGTSDSTAFGAIAGRGNVSYFGKAETEIVDGEIPGSDDWQVRSNTNTASSYGWAFAITPDAGCVCYLKGLAKTHATVTVEVKQGAVQVAARAISDSKLEYGATAQRVDQAEAAIFGSTDEGAIGVTVEVADLGGGGFTVPWTTTTSVVGATSAGGPQQDPGPEVQSVSGDYVHNGKVSVKVMSYDAGIFGTDGEGEARGYANGDGTITARTVCGAGSGGGGDPPGEDPPGGGGGDDGQGGGG